MWSQYMPPRVSPQSRVPPVVKTWIRPWIHARSVHVCGLSRTMIGWNLLRTWLAPVWMKYCYKKQHRSALNRKSRSLMIISEGFHCPVLTVFALLIHYSCNWRPNILNFSCIFVVISGYVVNTRIFPYQLHQFFYKIWIQASRWHSTWKKYNNDEINGKIFEKVLEFLFFLKHVVSLSTVKLGIPCFLSYDNEFEPLHWAVQICCRMSCCRCRAPINTIIENHRERKIFCRCRVVVVALSDANKRPLNRSQM